MLLGSNSVRGALGQCVSNCEIFPSSDIIRPGTAVIHSATHPPQSSGLAKSTALPSKVPGHKKTLTATHIDTAAYMSQHQKQAIFDPSKTYWQNSKVPPGALTTGQSYSMNCQSREDIGSGYLHQIGASSTS